MMKPTLLIVSLSGLLGLAGCESLNQPLDAGSGFNPLDTAGGGTSRIASGTVDASAARYTAGQRVETSMANSTFFRKIPKGNASADQVLDAGTPLEIVDTRGTFVKVKLENGAVGYVPEMMVVEPMAGADVPIVPIMDPSVMDVPDAPDLAPEPEIPGLEGAGGGAPSFSVPEPEIPGENADTPEMPDASENTVPSDVERAPEPEIPGLEEGDVAPPPEVPGISPDEDGQ